MNEVVKIRELPRAEILDAVNCAYITARFFKRSRAWFTQRLNNNIVNGKPVSFSPEELLELRIALKVIASDITNFTTHIPNLPTDMSIKVYVVDDPTLVDFIIDSDINGFKAYLDESKENDEFISFAEPEYVDTEAEALAFCSGIGFGTNERAIPERFPLRSCEEADLPFITAIETY